METRGQHQTIRSQMATIMKTTRKVRATARGATCKELHLIFNKTWHPRGKTDGPPTVVCFTYKIKSRDK